MAVRVRSNICMKTAVCQNVTSRDSTVLARLQALNICNYTLVPYCLLRVTCVVRILVIAWDFVVQVIISFIFSHFLYLKSPRNILMVLSIDLITDICYILAHAAHNSILLI